MFDYFLFFENVKVLVFSIYLLLFQTGNDIITFQKTLINYFDKKDKP